MTNKTISRRNFLKLAGMSLGSLAFSPQKLPQKQSFKRRLMRVAELDPEDPLVIRKEPNDQVNNILYQRYKDELINVYYEVESEFGPDYNPIWYRVWGGFAHRGKLQEVQYVLNPVPDSITKDFQLGEITVPYTRAMRYTSLDGWYPIYRLYYETTHWIKDIIPGPDGQAWYLLEDELLRPISYAIPATHMRLIADEEISPISPDVPHGEKRIEISITQQELTAYEGDIAVFQTKISSGVMTEEKRTPYGEFRILSKYASKHMGGGRMTSDIGAYVLVGVPWTCFFTENGVAIHGTYWHNDFGITKSSGCINMRNQDAKWIFRWVDPPGETIYPYRTGYGTRVTVF
jgi:hypothetical protein